jgi:hypothetical protein
MKIAMTNETNKYLNKNFFDNRVFGGKRLILCGKK